MRPPRPSILTIVVLISLYPFLWTFSPTYSTQRPSTTYLYSVVQTVDDSIVDQSSIIVASASLTYSSQPSTTPSSSSSSSSSSITEWQRDDRPGSIPTFWSCQELALLKRGLEEYGPGKWCEITRAYLPGKSIAQCEERWGQMRRDLAFFHLLRMEEEEEERKKSLTEQFCDEFGGLRSAALISRRSGSDRKRPGKSRSRTRSGTSGRSKRRSRYVSSEEDASRVRRSARTQPWRPWTVEEKDHLIVVVEEVGVGKWDEVAIKMNRTANGCKEIWYKIQRGREVPRPKLVRGAWSAEEDALLREECSRQPVNWEQVGRRFPHRTIIALRSRYQVLSRGMIRFPRWTAEEKNQLTQAIETLGRSCWKTIAEAVPGRSAYQCNLKWWREMRKKPQVQEYQEQ